MSDSYTRYDLSIDELHELLYMYPETIYNYYIYEIKFYSILDIDNIDERKELKEYLLLNYSSNRFCKDIKLGFILKSIMEDQILITIKNIKSNQYLGILTCEDMYPKNEFLMNLLCSVSKDPYTELTMSFGLLLQHILINYIYDNYEYENENDDVFTIYLNALEDVHNYYEKLGYEYGNDCSNRNQYIYKNEEGLYPMKICNLNKTKNIIYDKILSKLESNWKKILDK